MNGPAESIAYTELRGDHLPWSLLLDADESRDNVERYLKIGRCVGAFVDSNLVGQFVMTPTGNGTIELMNIAVDPGWRRHGIGSALVGEFVRRSIAAGATRLEVGTCNSSVANLLFYQRCGFRIDRVDRDFFVRSYPFAIVENGILCRDMVRLVWEGDALAPPTDGRRTRSVD